MDTPETQIGVLEDAGTTVVHPMGLLVLLICGISLLVIPRKYAVWPLIVLTCFLSSRQCVAIGGINFFLMRVLLVFFALPRIFMKGELNKFKFARLDAWVLAYGIFYWITGVVNWGFSLSEIKGRTSYLADTVLLYFVLRILIHTKEDGRMVIRGLCYAALVLAGFFGIEMRTGRNMFSVFGGVPEITDIREGRLRCQGAFGHPILAGTIWASFTTLILSEGLANRKGRVFYFCSLCAAIFIVIATTSSTPYVALAMAMVGMMLYPVRRFTSMAIWCSVCTLVVLHFLMKSPVWSLIARIRITGGNSGHHRYLLIDGFINHWEEWILLGSRVGTAHWGHFTFDTANQFVIVGVQGGLITLLAFIGMIIESLLAAKRLAKRDPLLGWSIGISIAVLCVSFLGISIWGQLQFTWALLLAMAGSLQSSSAQEAMESVQTLQRGTTIRGELG